MSVVEARWQTGQRPGRASFRWIDSMMYSRLCLAFSLAFLFLLFKVIMFSDFFLWFRKTVRGHQDMTLCHSVRSPTAYQKMLYFLLVRPILDHCAAGLLESSSDLHTLLLINIGAKVLNKRLSAPSGFQRPLPPTSSSLLLTAQDSRRQTSYTPPIQ